MESTLGDIFRGVIKYLDVISIYLQYILLLKGISIVINCTSYMLAIKLHIYDTCI